PKVGDVVVISAGASALGSLAGQIAKLFGCRVIGIAGSAEKCRWLTDALGFDGAIDYKKMPLFRRLRELCPRGIDIYFDGVGGSILEDVLNLLNLRARIVVAGMLSVYNDLGVSLLLPPGPNNLINLVFKRARMEGFVSTDYWSRATEAFDALLFWHRQGSVTYRAELVAGLSEAPRAMDRLFDGANR